MMASSEKTGVYDRLRIAAVGAGEDFPKIPGSSTRRNWADLPGSNGIRPTVLIGVISVISLALVWWRQPVYVSLPPVTAPRSVTGCAGIHDSSSIEDSVQRGNRLLHLWTDDELLSKAIAMEEVRPSNFPMRNSEQINYSRSSIGCLNKNLVGEKEVKACGFKIAFLFLLRGEPPLAPLWNKFFEGHEELYNIYVHVDPMNLTSITRSAGVFWGRIIPSQIAERGTPGLISAGRRLMANALIDDPRNEWFAIVSESCIPLHSLPYIYKTFSSTDKSFMGLVGSPPRLLSRYNARGENVMLPEIKLSDFRVSSQFFTLRRKHAVLVVKDNLYWSKFRLPCRNQYACFPEEHYFSTTIGIMDPNGTTNYAPTYVDWSGSVLCRRSTNGLGHPRNFCDKEVSVELIHNLQTREDGHFMFARKFTPDSLPGLLEIVDEILKP